MLSIAHTASQIRIAHPAIILDDASNNLSGYIVIPAESISKEQVAVLINHARAVVCVAMQEDQLRKFELNAMTNDQLNSTTDMTVSVEAREGVTTGISAADRAHTLKILAMQSPTKRDIVSPGHIFPVKALKGGVLQRSGIAEAAVDFLKLTNQQPVAAFCQCLDETGELASKEYLEKLATTLDIPIITISEIIRQRLINNSIIEKVAEAELPTTFAGTFRAHCFTSETDNSEHIALVKGDISLCDESGKQLPVVVRVQAENKIGDLLGTKKLLQRKNIQNSLREIDKVGRGVFVFIRHTKQGAVSSSVSSSNSQPENQQKQALRQHGIGAQILNNLGIKRIALLTNSSKDVSGVTAFGLEIVEYLAIPESNT